MVLSEQAHFNPEISCRKAMASDVECLLPIWLAMMTEHASRESAFLLSEEAQEAWRDMVTQMVHREDAFVFVAGPVSQPWAFCLGWVARNPKVYAAREVGFISELAVSSEVRRRGQGRLLVEAARAWFQEQGLVRFQLTAAHFNKGARGFWRALGGHALLVRYQFEVSEFDEMKTH